MADKVDEYAPEGVKDGASTVVSKLVGGRSDGEREADEQAANAANAASWDDFTGWQRGHFGKLKKLGVPGSTRGQLYDLYFKAWNYAHPVATDVMPNYEAAAGLRATAAKMEQTAIAKAAAFQKKKAEEAKRTKLPVHYSKAGEAPIPGAIRGEVKHRVKNHQQSGTIPYCGITYHFTYQSVGNIILVHGGPNSSIIPYRPPWKA